ncbi:MAG: hypothetical protein ACI8TQ_003180 [Planctomycetota bacterium]|jgi:hypothetical protein
MRITPTLCLCLLLLSCNSGNDGGSSSSSCTPGVLLSGTVLPDVEGWVIQTNLMGTPDITTDGTAVRVNTQVDSASSPFALVALDTGLEQGTEFTLQWSMTVNAADTHNNFDAGVAVLPSYAGTSFGTSTERGQLIYFDTNEIGWGDLSQSYVLDTTTLHSYLLSVNDDGDATVSVDGTVRLDRSDIEISGTVAFGDQTNDADLDGDFSISDIELICP